MALQQFCADLQSRVNAVVGELAALDKRMWESTKCREDLPLLAWHYTVSPRFEAIMRSGYLLRGRDLDPKGDFHEQYVWFTLEQDWEIQAAFWDVFPPKTPLPDRNRIPESLLDRGVTPYRFGVRTSRLYGPAGARPDKGDTVLSPEADKIMRSAGWLVNAAVRATLGIAGNQKTLGGLGRSLALHYVSLEPVPLSAVVAIERFDRERRWTDATAHCAA